MSDHLAELAKRRARLVEDAAAQRVALAEGLASWRRPLAMADHGLNAIRLVKTLPVWVVGSALLPAVLRPGGVGKWIRRGLVTWQVIRRLTGRTPPPGLGPAVAPRQG